MPSVVGALILFEGVGVTKDAANDPWALKMHGYELLAFD